MMDPDRFPLLLSVARGGDPTGLSEEELVFVEELKADIAAHPGWSVEIPL